MEIKLDVWVWRRGETSEDLELAFLLHWFEWLAGSPERPAAVLGGRDEAVNWVKKGWRWDFYRTGSETKGLDLEE